MRQTLFHIPSEIFGLSLLGFHGLLFWGFLLWAVIWFAWSVLRRGLNSDDIGFVFVILLVAVVAGVFLPKIADPYGLPIRGYGTMLVLAIASASGLLIYRGCRKHRIPSDMMFSLVLWCVVSGLLGARVFHIVEYLPTYMNSPNPLGNMLLFTEGGLVVYGGIIGGMIGTAVFFWRNKLSLLAMYDVMAPALLLGIALGRLGCLMNGCCYGAACDTAYGITFPPTSPAWQGQVFNNQTFVGGLKFAPYESSVAQETAGKSVSQETAAGNASDRFNQETAAGNAVSAANGVTGNSSSTTTTRNGGGCACAGCGKREMSKAEQERLATLPAMIADVKPGSSAVLAGLKPGMIVRQIQVGHRVSDGLNATLAKDYFYTLSLDYPNADVLLTVMQPGDNTVQEFRFALSPPEVLPVYPTQIMSFFGAICLSLLILFFERFCKRDGFAFMLFLFLYSTGRFCIEFFRDDEASFLCTGLSIAQNVSIAIFTLGIVVAIYIFSRMPCQALDIRFPVITEISEADREPRDMTPKKRSKSGKK